MYKKIGISLLIALIFTLPLQIQYSQNANAAVASKVASQAAKKIAKEVVVDEAINTAMNFALMEAIEIADNYQAKEGYKVVCPSGGAVCDKPIQVKTTLTDSDKSALRGQTDIELEKAITGGKGLTKWQKFMDWFVPVWITSFAATALTYAVDPNARSLFNEVGYNALVALGFITPLTTNDPVPLAETDTVTEDDGSPVKVVKPDYVISNINSNATAGTGNIRTDLNPLDPSRFTGHFLAEWSNIAQQELRAVNFDVKAVGTFRNQYNIYYTGTNYQIMNFEISRDLFTNGANTDVTGVELTVAKNGEVLTTIPGLAKSSPANYLFVNNSDTTEIDINTKRAISIKTRQPYEVNGFYYTDTLVFTSTGDMYEFQVKTNTINPTAYNSFDHAIHYAKYAGSQPNQAQSKIFYDVEPMKKILPPMYEEIEADENISQKSQYEDDQGNVALIPPSAITYEEEATGEQVERKPNATGDGYIFEKPDGTIVPEEEVHVPPNWEPNIQPNPDGVPQITPSPTPSNPNPEPIPLTPTPTPQPEPEPGDGTGTPTTPGEEPPLEPFPDGAKCEEGLKFPIFSPLKETFSTSFPFSIPWDIERAINAAFSGIGTEKPSFSLDLEFLGSTETIDITTPALFDDWKPFTDTLLLLIFDVMIMFGVYRFVKGAGS